MLNYEDLYNELTAGEKKMKDALALANRYYKNITKDSAAGDLKDYRKATALYQEALQKQQEALDQLKHLSEAFDSAAYFASGDFTEQLLNEAEKAGVAASVKEAGFYTTHNNMNYEIFIYSFGKNEPRSPVSKNLLSHSSGKINYAGYHSVKIPEYLTLTKNEYISVVLKLSKNFMPVESPVKNYSENAIIKSGESYFSVDGTNWSDGSEKKINSNACIKIFTVER